MHRTAVKTVIILQRQLVLHICILFFRLFCSSSPRNHIRIVLANVGFTFHFHLSAVASTLYCSATYFSFYDPYRSRWIAPYRHGGFFFACLTHFSFHSIEIVVVMVILRQLSIDTTVVEVCAKKNLSPLYNKWLAHKTYDATVIYVHALQWIHVYSIYGWHIGDNRRFRTMHYNVNCIYSLAKDTRATQARKE